MYPLQTGTERERERENIHQKRIMNRPTSLGTCLKKHICNICFKKHIL
jgi:hypothetical protein